MLSQTDKPEIQNGCGLGDSRWSGGMNPLFLLLFAPLVLLPDLLLFAGREVVLDVERFSDVLGSLALDHVGHSLAGDVQ